MKESERELLIGLPPRLHIATQLLQGMFSNAAIVGMDNAELRRDRLILMALDYADLLISCCENDLKQ